MNQVLKEDITLVAKEEPLLLLRPVTADDLENLRQWKNEQREFFFHKEEIVPEQQRDWFIAFQGRPHDFMFMAELDSQTFGCMGIRWQGSSWDVYNVILGRHEFGRRGLMGAAFKTMLAFALSVVAAPITLQVLEHNLAVKWYLKNGFVVTAENTDYYTMTYQANDSIEEAL